jgi:C-terminal processing protease CtpA/Prc
LKKYLSFFRDKHLQFYDPIEIKEKEYKANFKAKNSPKFTDLDTATVLVSVPSFNYKLHKELDSFCDSISPLIKKRKHLIIDLRNNGGGGERMYKQLYNIVRQKSKKETVALIINQKCASACEEFVLKLKSQKNIVCFVSNTNGQFEYGFIK